MSYHPQRCAGCRDYAPPGAPLPVWIACLLVPNCPAPVHLVHVDLHALGTAYAPARLADFRAALDRRWEASQRALSLCH